MWADGAAIKREVDLRIMLLLGPKTEADWASPKKKVARLQSEKPLKNTPVKVELKKGLYFASHNFLNLSSLMF